MNNEAQIWREFYETHITRLTKQFEREKKIMLWELMENIHEVRKDLEWNDPVNSAYTNVQVMIEKKLKEIKNED